MRVLWFTNTFLPGKEESTTDTLRRSGGWMMALCEAIQKKSPDLRLGIVSTRKVSTVESYHSGGIDCFVIPVDGHLSKRKQGEAIRQCSDIINDWKPDVIHIHGTEQFFGLISTRSLISKPTVISIQGLLNPYSEWMHFFGNRSILEVFKLHRLIGLPFMRGAIWDYYRIQKGAVREKEIMRGNNFFMGRTHWDRAHLGWINPEAEYFHVGEVIRRPFWEVEWALEGCNRHRLVFTNAGHPRKGTELLLKAADHLKRAYGDLEVVIIGELSARNGYGRRVKKEIEKRKGFVRELGALNAEQIASEMLSSHVFISPSFIDNSPNAVCEAQLVGLPVVSSFTGGLASIVDSEKTGLLFPSGDAAYLAECIKRVFDNDDLAKSLSEEARTVAKGRHDSDVIVQDLLNCYSTILSQV